MMATFFRNRKQKGTSTEFDITLGEKELLQLCKFLTFAHVFEGNLLELRAPIQSFLIDLHKFLLEEGLL